MDKRLAKKETARLSSDGYLRLSSDLMPVGHKEMDLKFIVTTFPQDKQLVLRVVKNGTGNHLAKRKAIYTNPASLCPQVSVKAAMKFMGMRLPKKSKVFPVKREEDILIVQF